MGTFIAMDILIDKGQARQTVDMYACVTKLRQQRVNMVQTAVSSIVRVAKTCSFKRQLLLNLT
ncbi:hypothetical protein DPMN_103321 [Dreissena polymorpha]|uniref:Tyrosine-protein phosphatase domain-containing protein n=1 Tax=Dreissena polymorpha TaxID=45954 RepID=A0A9D4HAX6_DREPO|nr:hypothetical protein DPMN_103321 [Dreissena polymorpha]